MTAVSNFATSSDEKSLARWPAFSCRLDCTPALNFLRSCSVGGAFYVLTGFALPVLGLRKGAEFFRSSS